jgi:hypothetical protein
MQFNRIATGLSGSYYLLLAGRNESADQNTQFVHSFCYRRKAPLVFNAIQTPFGRKFDPFFRYEGYLLRPYLFGKFDNRLGYAHF